jgi:hypothetical protein
MAAFGNCRLIAHAQTVLFWTSAQWAFSPPGPASSRLVGLAVADVFNSRLRANVTIPEHPHSATISKCVPMRRGSSPVAHVVPEMDDAEQRREDAIFQVDPGVVSLVGQPG